VELPLDLLPLAAGYYPLFCCPWRLAPALRSSAPGGWLLPFVLMPLVGWLLIFALLPLAACC